MTAGFRYEPQSTALDRVIRRPRVVALLRRRFDARLTTLVAGAGSGKTTVLALAAESNRMDPDGVDVWLGAESLDRDPAHLLSGLATALAVPTAHQADGDIDSIVAAVWSRAPTDVALIIDDAHLLVGPSASATVTELLERLPANGHLVLAGRRLPDIAVARLRAHDRLVEITEDQLELDDAELEALIVARGGSGATELPRHAALADLHLRAGDPVRASSDFLWEEVLSSLSEIRRSTLVRAAVLEEIDDPIVDLLSDGALDAATLVGGLPLIEPGAASRYRLHALLRAALSSRLEADAHAETCREVAALESDRGNLRQAIEIAHAGGHDEAALRWVRQYVLLPTLRRSFADQLVVRDIVERIEPGSLLARLMQVECEWGELNAGTQPGRIAARFASLAADARAAGDEAIEAPSLFRSIQARFNQDAGVAQADLDRLVELGRRAPFAAQVAHYVRAEQAMNLGDPTAALAHLDTVEVHDADLDIHMRAGLLAALGRPEEVGSGLGHGDLDRLPEGAEIYVAYAMWLRGELPPELALPIARTMTAETVSRRIVTTSVSILGVTAFIALAAGDIETARHCVASARGQARWGVSPRIGVFTPLAAAGLALAEYGEDAARELVDEAIELAPLGQWPPRSYLLALPLVYTLRPDAREMLDRCWFGPSLSLAMDAARALVALRDTGSADAALGVDWHQVDRLRVHVLPPHLTELAVAAASIDVPGAAGVLEMVPDRQRWLARVASGDGAAAVHARALLTAEPPRPSQRVAIRTLGPLELWRDGVAVEDRGWTRRSRVRELLALLVEDRRVARPVAAARLWPELDDDRAASNLRVNLTHLQRVLEPDRPGERPPWFVRTAAEHLVLAPDVEVDLDRFDAGLTRATEHDRAGDPGAALEAYRAALELYAGDYLEGIEADWVEPTRQRLRLVAVSAMCRVGELVLARGEPEEAGAWALRAARHAPGNERAGRLHGRSLVAVGDRAGAATVLRRLVADLGTDGVEPEADTSRLLGRLTGSGAG